jgi:hypothetical protein
VYPLRNLLVALFKSSRTARMHPEHPGLGMGFSDSIGILDREL